MAERMFPVLKPFSLRPTAPPFPDSVPWGFIADNEKNAKRNHGQTVERLAQRGGLSPLEMLAVVTGRTFWTVPHGEAGYAELRSCLEEWKAGY